MLAVSAISLTACNDKKESAEGDTINVDTAATHEHDGHGHSHAGDSHEHDHDGADAVVEVEAPVTVTINGTVGEITFGKDGYTAQLKDDGGREYFVTISRANLDDPKQYRELKAGDKITVKGESFKLDNKLHIKVEELK